MSESIQFILDELARQIRLQDETYKALAARYDEALKRIHDMQAELEYLRREVGRG